MNRNVGEAGGALLIVSQFTLYADCRKGRRPSFDQAAPPEHALPLYNYFVEVGEKRTRCRWRPACFRPDAGSSGKRRPGHHPNRFRGRNPR